jgi:diketogulonate reductase-like aldo/keto reductase
VPQRSTHRHDRAGALGHRLEENLGAAAIQLTTDDLREIDHAASRIEVHGARYPEHLQKMVGR